MGLTRPALTRPRAAQGGASATLTAAAIKWLAAAAAAAPSPSPLPRTRRRGRLYALLHGTRHRALAVRTTGGHSMGSATIKGNTGMPAALAAATTPLATAAAKVASYQACIRLVHAYSI